jgi:flagellar motor component MotA
MSRLTARDIDMIEIYKTINETCTTSDRDSCKEYVYRMYSLADLARKNGILSYEEIAEHEQNLFLKTAMNLAVDGTDMRCTSDVLYALMLSVKHTGIELLSRLIIFKGIMSILRGDNPYVIAKELAAVLGEKYIAEIMDTVRNK